MESRKGRLVHRADGFARQQTHFDGADQLRQVARGYARSRGGIQTLQEAMQISRATASRAFVESGAQFLRARRGIR